MGAYIWRGDLTEAFLRYEFGGAYIWRGLYVEALIFGILRYRVFLGPVWFRGEGTQQSFIRGGSAPRSRPLPFSIIYPLLENIPLVKFIKTTSGT